MRMRKILFLLLFFFFTSNKVFAGNCSYNDSLIYFSSPSETVSKYNPSYYCSDILYLIKTKKGNISLDEYKKLYPSEVSRNVDYLRKIGITPNIFDEYIDEDIIDDTDENFEKNEKYKNFKTKEKTDLYIKNLVDNLRSDEKLYAITSEKFEPDPELFNDEKIGGIVNSEKKYKSCIKTNDLKPSESSLYSSDNVGYYQIISAIPLALRPVVVSGNSLKNAFDMDVAIIENNTAFGLKNNRFINFSDEIFEKNNTASVQWKNHCQPNTLEQKVEKNSTCYLCPYIVMIFNEISYLFNYMYSTFKYIMLVFLIIFGSLFMVFEFLKGFSALPFDADFTKYPKSIAKKLQTILIVCTIIWIPPKELFSWTVQPVLDLTLYISDYIMNVENVKEMKCNAERLFDKNNDEMEIPPIVKQKQQAKLSLAKDTSILSKTTMENVICFLNNTLRANGRQMTMGEVLFTNAFDYKIEYENRLLGFIFGVVIFGLYFLISIMISFYILDGLLNFLELAIMWPVYVFGYAFPVVNQNFNVKNIMGKAKSFGLTMINLAVFSIFNSALLNSFYFVGSKENLLTILDKAIKNNDVSLIISSFPTDLLAITQFLFIVYCIYYIYSKLGEFASTYGGSMGQITVVNNIRNIINKSRTAFTSVSMKDFFTKKSPKDADEKNTTQETVQEETVQEENTNE